MLFDYDDTDLNSVLNYAKKMENSTFRDILNLCKEYILEADNGNKMNRSEKFINSLKNDKLLTLNNAKGQLGNFIEKFYFGYEPNSNQNADLDKIGVEIKQTPIDIKKDGTLTAGERLVITMISYKDPVEDDFYKSHVYEKINKILLVQYIRDKSKNRLDNQIKYVNLFTPPPEDLEIIINDYKVITQKIKEGKAHELSESDTYYLGACTKGSTAQSSWREQYYGNHIPAKRRAFCLKNSYMTHVLQDYVLTHKLENESIIKNIDELKHLSFEQIIISKIERYKNKTDKELCSLFDREYNNNKSQWIDLCFRMLGIKGNHAEEFEKANVKVKAIRLEENGKNRESMSFPSFKYKDYSVNDLVASSFPVSAKLGAAAFFLAVILGVSAGVIAALKQNTKWDYTVMGLAMTGVVIPSFVVAPLLVMIFAIILHWLPGGGWNGGALKFMILPMVALSLAYIASIARITRGSMIEVLHSNFIRTARAKGLPMRRIILRHALKPALLPVLSYMGPAFVGIITGSMVIETIYGLPGIGQLFVNGALNRDYSLVLSLTILVGALTILFNAIVDVLYAVIDPKIRY